jgi:hypothetical protein
MTVTYMVVLFNRSDDPTYVFRPAAFLAVWQHWDTGFFLAIAQYGYYDPAPTVYYPMYPLLIHITAVVLGGTRSLLLAAILISNLSALVACIGIGLLAVQLEGTENGARNAIVVTLAYPLAFFLVAPYSESTFLAFATWALVFMYQRAWYRASICAFLAGFTRPTAVILILPLIWEYGRQKGWWLFLRGHWRIWQWKPENWSRQLRQSWRYPQSVVAVVQLLVVPEAVLYALALYAIYCDWRFGSPWIFVQSEVRYWLHRPMLPWQSIGIIVTSYMALPPWSYSQARFLLDALPLAVFALLTFLSIKFIPFSSVLYMMGLLALCIASPVINGTFPYVVMSTGRFLVVSIPLFILLGRWVDKHAWLNVLVIGGGFTLQALLTVFYLKGVWIV